MRERAIALLKTLTEAHSVPGFEDEVRSIFVNELRGKGELSSDKCGSVVCSSKGKGPKILITGHMDEIGFMVQSITPDGFIQVVALGGWWTHTLLSQRMEIRNNQGRKIMGMFCLTPPHFLPEGQRKQVVDVDALFIDIGASSREEVIKDFGISIGAPIAPLSSFTPLEKENLFMAKAFDNRVGMAGAIQVFQALANEDLPCQLIVAGTVQEEVGLRGAKALAHFVKPDVVLVLEGPPADDTPGFSKLDRQGKLGAGVQIRRFDPSAIGNPRLANLVEKVATEQGIRHQMTVRRSGGTDAGSFNVAESGIPCIVLGTPTRYIHSHNGIIDLEDYLEMVKLCLELVKILDAKTVESLTDFLDL
jgi:putative aminopeptidase FrvX